MGHLQAGMSTYEHIWACFTLGWDLKIDLKAELALSSYAKMLFFPSK